MAFAYLALIYVLFILSGATALVYQIVWVRALTLVFGGSHLAVTAVLTIFMGGLAIGGYAIGRKVDRAARPLQWYGLLELAIGASALLFVGLVRIYPTIYVSLARGRDESAIYLTSIRMLFSIVALIIPTLLMGGTLPVLSRFVSRQPENLRSHLAFLYGFNTLGAVIGALLAGFVLLRLYAVSTTLYIAVAGNILIGCVSIWLQTRVAPSVPDGAERDPTGEPAGGVRLTEHGDAELNPFRLRIVLWGIGVSGFCALGYEVLWTRVLTIAVGASVYGFTIMLVAFLTGIALGSKAYGLLVKIARVGLPATRTLLTWFGVTQVLIGITALLVTIYLRDIPVNAVRLQSYFFETALSSFGTRVWTNFALSFLYMVVPALFMGAAFPLAGEIVSRHRNAVGRAVGEVLASNTVGAILGAAASGFVMIRAFGIERSLQILTVINIGVGLVAIASLRTSRRLAAALAGVSVAFIAFLAINQTSLRIWDQKYFAIFRNNQPEAFRTPEMIREAVENTDVLFYGEGVESTVSAIRVKGGEQAFVTNGRVEAASHPQARQLQFTLGHLPMLLNRHPKEVLVVGMGSGMTAGATAVHASVERVTLVEIEPQVLGVARTFEAYNHRLLDNPRVKVVLNDGRNFLLTTDRTFDAITADPIHPWFRGAGYLYTREYFQLAARHLRPGGIVAQWLPLYELSQRDVASIVKTFQQQFPYTMLWLTHYDSVMVGSNRPFQIDEAELQRRISSPAVSSDLRAVAMGSADDFLSYFALGTEGMRRLADSGTLNTDDYPYLEFSAPFSIAMPSVMADNVRAISTQRESILPYLKPAEGGQGRDEQRRKWELQLAAGRRADPALALFLEGGRRDPAFAQSLRRLSIEYPWYAPGRFLYSEYLSATALEPRLLQQSAFRFLNDDGDAVEFEMSAVLVPVSRTRASIMFVDNDAQVVYGQVYIDDYDRNERANKVAGDVMTAIAAAYQNEVTTARAEQRALPLAAATLPVLKAAIGESVHRVSAGS